MEWTVPFEEWMYKHFFYFYATGRQEYVGKVQIASRAKNLHFANICVDSMLTQKWQRTQCDLKAECMATEPELHQ